MKKLCFLLILALLLSLGASAFADNGVEIIYMDGIPVVMESFGLFLSDSDFYYAIWESFNLPAALVDFGEEAFAGIPASRVEITENVKTIGRRAFADCPNLTALVIPATEETIDDTALQGSINVTIYGEAGSEAQRFAEASNIPFVDINAETQPVENVALRPPVALPYVPFNG